MVEAEAVSPARADRPLVLALDIGSSSVRAAVHDRTGRPVRGLVARGAYQWEVGRDGSVRLPAHSLLDLVGTVLDQLATLLGPHARDIVAGGISCFWHSIVGLDSTAEALTPVLSWADTTSAGEAAALRKRVDADGAHRDSGAPIHASYWPARVARLRSEQAGIARWVGFPELITMFLTGRDVTSRSMASGTGLLDRARGTWHRPLAAQFEVDVDELPPIVADDEPVGRLAGHAASRWANLAHLTWFAPWGDGACGNVGLGAFGAHKAALMVGSSGALRAIVDGAAPRLPAGLFGFRLGDGAVVGGQLSEGGGTLSWLARLLRRSRESLEADASALDADAHGLTVLPYTFGERGLGYHDHASGTILGLSPSTDAASVYRAFVESIALGFAALDDRLMEVLGSPPAIVASGGSLTHSPLMAQVIADALGRDIGVARESEASRRGAALLTLRGIGEIAHLGEVTSPPVRVVRSDPARAARYRQARERRQELYESTRERTASGQMALRRRPTPMTELSRPTRKVS